MGYVLDRSYNAGRRHCKSTVVGYSADGSNFACWKTYMQGLSRGACSTYRKQKQAPVNDKQSLLAVLWT